MAYTKIHAIKASVSAAVNYICNPAKTDEQILIDSFGCSPETAPNDFKFALSKGRSSDNNKAFHLIQSFMPGEVSYEEAHQIGIELADRLLAGKYSYVVATHIDHDHVHNHIVFCATDNIEHKKYDDNKRSYHHIRQLSDELCNEHNLSIIKPGPKRGTKYNEWAANKEGKSWKTKLRNDIDECIKASKDYTHFLELIKAKGYEIKGENLEDPSAKYIAFRPLEGKQFVRGSDRSLGPGYTKESISTRIIESHKRKVKFPTRNPSDPSDEIKTKTVEELISKSPKDPAKEARTTLIDTASDRISQSAGLTRWANVQNLKAAAHAYAVADSIKELQEKIEAQSAIVKTSKSSLVALERKMKTAADILHYAEIYKDNLKYSNAHKRSKDPDRYYRNHDTELQLFYAAEHVLKDNYGINPDKMNYAHMLESYSLMQDKKKALTDGWKAAESELRDLENKLKLLQEYLGSSGAESMQSHVHEENHEEESKHPEPENQQKKNGQQL